MEVLCLCAVVHLHLKCYIQKEVGHLKELTPSTFIANNEMKSSLKFCVTVLSTHWQSRLQILQLDRHFKTVQPLTLQNATIHQPNSFSLFAIRKWEC